jgi:U3 small nucleolar RNA-associated protein 13
MLVVKAVVTTIPAAKLATSYEGIPEILAGIWPYAERHFDRLDRMVGDSYLLDFTLTSMGSLHGPNNEDYHIWSEQRSNFVLPPKEAEGKVQIGGSLIVGGKRKVGNPSGSSDDDVITIGDSDTEASSADTDEN